jgi:hypothetical protein
MYFITQIQNNMNNKIKRERLYTAIDKQGIVSAHNYIRFLKPHVRIFGQKIS